MNFKSVFEQVQADLVSKVEQVRADVMNPERLAKAQQSVDALSGLVEVARENMENVLNDVQNGLMLISENIAEANAEAVDDTVKRETPNDWATVTDIFDSWAKDNGWAENRKEPVPEEKSEPNAYNSKPDSSWSYREKVEWLIANDKDWAETWKDEDPALIVQDESNLPEIVAHLRNALVDQEVDRVWGEKFSF